MKSQDLPVDQRFTGSDSEEECRQKGFTMKKQSTLHPGLLALSPSLALGSEACISPSSWSLSSRLGSAFTGETFLISRGVSAFFGMSLALPTVVVSAPSPLLVTPQFKGRAHSVFTSTPQDAQHSLDGFKSADARAGCYMFSA